ncbi:MAG: glycerophosphoryl diester phosphodiesterase [Saccharospirillum sp.]|nr:glycerophosphoryl diester phosphodiesterase [Saccharospirillum sp.]
MIADRLIAHRGCSLLAPENTLGAMALTKNLGVTWVEIDANLVGDGNVIVFHDNHLNRLTNGQGKLVDTNLGALSKLEAGSHFSADYAGEPIPTLDAMLQQLSRDEMGLNLEIKVYPEFKAEQIVPAVIRSLENHWQDFDRLIISSFSIEALALVRQQKPEWQLGQLWVNLPKNWLALAEPLDLVSIHCDGERLTEEQAQAVKAAGYDLYVYTINDKAEGEKLFTMGVDGLITDDPTLFAELDIDHA